MSGTLTYIYLHVVKLVYLFLQIDLHHLHVIMFCPLLDIMILVGNAIALFV